MHLKGSSRLARIMSMVIIFVCMFIGYTIGQYRFDIYIAMIPAVFILAMIEYECCQMRLFMQAKNSMPTEKTSSDNKRTDLNQALLQQILPPQVKPETFEEVTIFFSDVVGFTDICAQVPPIEVVKMLNRLYTVMDYCTAQFPLYKVETIGDAYMVSDNIFFEPFSSLLT